VERILNLQTAKSTLAFDAPSLQPAPLGSGSVAPQPRYIIDARPVSYEPSSF